MTLIRHIIRPLLVAVALSPLASLAQEGTSLESDWIELVKGHKGATLGVELRDIQTNEGDGSRTVTLAVPKSSIADPDTIEEVVVTARGPQQAEPPAPLPVRFQWLDDYDADNYGLVIHLGEGNWPIRLYLNSQPGYVRD